MVDPDEPISPTSTAMPQLATEFKIGLTRDQVRDAFSQYLAQKGLSLQEGFLVNGYQEVICICDVTGPYVPELQPMVTNYQIYKDLQGEKLV